MTISGYTYNEFGEKLNAYVSASQPIQSLEHLLGRSSELERIKKSLFAPGRHVFIYGERGVGKSSLAATAANQYQSADSSYIDVSCAPDATLISLIINIAYIATDLSHIKTISTSVSSKLNLRYLTLENNRVEVQSNLNDTVRTLSDAICLLKEVTEIHSERPIVVIDEFDRIHSAEERNRFADLLKQLGDKKIPIKFIFTGVGTSLKELLGSHHSAIRQLETIELSKLSWDARWEILLSAAKAFNISVEYDICVRIAAISDGYPYYVHLITEKLLWRVFEDENKVSEVSKDHFQSALRDAIAGITAELNRPYELAVNRRSIEYEAIIWATADSDYLQSSLVDMYASYKFIMKQLDESPLIYDQFSQQIRNLKKQRFGEILVSDMQRGYYTYREKMLRGYVRLQAEANNVELLGEEAKPTQKEYMKAPAKSSTGYYQSRPPKGVHFGRNRN
ncbi:AAA family ATPase [Methylophaga thiooxydans]|uniref:Archaeal ATPase family n=1 Tax=Methylophaga thiooxydans DMS010 TaxID=637616 RepID=C0N2U3_9GAMM|nr:ATP-binding protein [Methylophaga thiooxydans]EEF80888.1 Archaeal ATPase family [Methylophaga thiooxydans DMS010]